MANFMGSFPSRFRLDEPGHPFTEASLAEWSPGQKRWNEFESTLKTPRDSA
jgi:hypothetical protein